FIMGFSLVFVITTPYLIRQGDPIFYNLTVWIFLVVCFRSQIFLKSPVYNQNCGGGALRRGEAFSAGWDRNFYSAR
ncbi:MAG: hypothetical protein IJH68_04935, partial [Thermoguttaceae bacterium]|nr:hypothetical protein [Thermoguttaceae bacterium]